MHMINDQIIGAQNYSTQRLKITHKTFNIM